MKLFLAGEGPDELGEWFHFPSLRNWNRGPGVIEALLLRVAPAGWAISGAIVWKRIVKFRAGEQRAPETRNVLGAALKAKEAGSDALVFLRDRDGDRERQVDLERGLLEARAQFPEIDVCGGVVVEALEAWVLAMLDVRGSEHLTAPKATLSQAPHSIATRAAMVTVIEETDLAAIPSDAASLRLWMDRARLLLGQ